jgi:hypothetical protein
MARSKAKTEGQAGDAAKPRALKPAHCRALMRRRLAQEFHDIVDGFVKQAKLGSCPHVKLATELVQMPNKIVRKKTPAERMLEEFGRQAGAGAAWPWHGWQVSGRGVKRPERPCSSQRVAARRKSCP